KTKQNFAFSGRIPKKSSLGLHLMWIRNVIQSKLLLITSQEALLVFRRRDLLSVARHKTDMNLRIQSARITQPQWMTLFVKTYVVTIELALV
ncbi:MAG: hypothetical protein DRH04_09220, partial [Deltaproteobacteria bacterium]